jgi:hypothetical protein
VNYFSYWVLTEGVKRDLTVLRIEAQEREMTTYSPPLEVPPATVEWLRSRSDLAFAGDMLRVMQRAGGLTQRQLDMIEAARVAS